MENKKYNKRESYPSRDSYPNRDDFKPREFQKRERKESADEFIFGVRAVIEAIKADREINKIMILKGMNKDLFQELKDILANKNYYLQFVPVEKLDKITDNNHQGVIAFVAPITYGSVEKLVEQMMEEGKKPTVLVLDRITDVRNFGAIARTAECQGVDAILIPSKGSVQVTSDAIKTSAGALNRIPVCKSDNIKDTLFYLQQCGMRIIACTEKTNIPLYTVNLRGSVVIILGSEEDGITNDFLNMADIKAKIPMRGEIASMNVGVAAAIVLYEKTRQELYG
jgi:23S rRNA (guanosine2251-2'-O)-methyltransferase